jgi:RNA polymerase sigma-70 factor (ECF subfamily)
MEALARHAVGLQQDAKILPDNLWPSVVSHTGGASLAQTCDIAAIFKRHAQAVYRLCYTRLGSAADAEDAVQQVFMKLVDAPRTFEDEGHERAWLIVCASNLCKDLFKSAAVSRRSDLPDEVPDARAKTEVDETLDAVMRLPDIYKDVVYLHYYEGYKTDEIARMLGSPPSTIRNRLSEARKLLREALGGEGDDGN